MSLKSWIAFCVLSLFVAACGGGGGGDDGEKTDTLPDQQDGGLIEIVVEEVLEVSPDVQGQAYVFPPPAVTTTRFTVIAEANTTLGLEGQTFELKVRIGHGAAVGEVAWDWDLDGGAKESGSGSLMNASFATEGLYAVAVIGTDEDGNKAESGVTISVVSSGALAVVGDVDGDGAVGGTDLQLLGAYLDGAGALDALEYRRADVDLDGTLTTEDLALVEGAVEAGLPAPSHLWPAEGALGARVRLVHPELLDPSAVAQVVFAGTDALVPMRLLPGYATFVVPPELDSATETTLRLMVDGQEASQFPFTVLPPFVGSAEPGSKLVQAMEETGLLMAEFQLFVDTYVTLAGLESDERAVLQGMVHVAAGSYIAGVDTFLATFSDIEPDARAGFERVALANGLDGLLADIADIKTEMAAFTGFPERALYLDPGEAEALAGILCAAHQLTETSEAVAEVAAVASAYLAWFDYWPTKDLPMSGQMIQFLVELTNQTVTIVEIAGVVSDYLPEVGGVRVECTPAALAPGESVECSAALELQLTSSLCEDADAGGVAGIMESLENEILLNLVASVPLFGQSFESADFLRDEMDEVTALIYDSISAIAGSVLDAMNVEQLLQAMAETVCQMTEEPLLTLGAEVLDSDCGDLNDSAWQCAAQCSGVVTISATATVCGEEGTDLVEVLCGGCSPGACDGCCDNAECVEAGSQSDGKCGADGETCQACGEYFFCADGKCSCTSDCAEVGAASCSDNDVYVCTAVSAVPPCNKLTFSEPCLDGAECVDGDCVVSCGPDNCGGCCLEDGTCMPGNTSDFCGGAGVVCLECGASPVACVEGSCECVPICQGEGKDCGDDGCGGNCGECEPALCEGEVFLPAAACLEGVCTSAESKSCDDGNPCTENLCDPATGCENVNLPDDALGTETCGMGPCNQTVNKCLDGEPNSCDPLEGAVEEICNGLDDDCDGNFDELEDLDLGPCSTTNEHGSCPGTEQCMMGVVLCDASTPTVETCDGLDNDCDGFVDNDMLLGTCTVENEFGVCVGSHICDGVNGLLCDGQIPEMEICDGQDNDCDGDMDEDFTNDMGEYDLFEHCGGCNLSCAGAIAHASETACGSIVGPPSCFAITCNSGYYLDPSSECVDHLDTTCQVCETDFDCSGSKCVEFDNVMRCAMPCAAQEDCGAEEACANYDGKGDLCQPATGSCECNAAAEGAHRDCSIGNMAGTCVGQEVCDSAVGWSACDAQEPAAETCNAVDDNCDGQTDEGFPNYDDDAQADCVDSDDDNDGDMDATDCQPLNAAVYHSAAETCNGKDDNCTGGIDEELGTTTCGLGPCNHTVDNCLAGIEQTCDPFEGAISEKCDGLDNDCDGDADEAFPLKGGDCVEGLGACESAGIYVCSDDGLEVECNAPPIDFTDEVCNNIDDDCDGETDEGEDLVGCTDHYLDADDDGYGVLDFWKCLCHADGEYRALQTGDCNENDAAVNPGATEACNGIDDNCDWQIDETGASGCTDYYLDEDSDGYGTGDALCECEAPGEPFDATQDGDCDDEDFHINPDGEEECNEGDDDCDGEIDEEDAIGCMPLFIDGDQDSFGSGDSKCLCGPDGEYDAYWAGDCDDGNEDVNPEMSEICDDLDNDCNEAVDDGFYLPGCNYYFLDLDDDGYGALGSEPECLCAPMGIIRAEEAGDCLDNNFAVNPGVTEVCGDGIDNNCNELQNEIDAQGCQEFYHDGDHDGYGTEDSLCICEASQQFIPYIAEESGDCADMNQAVNPGADEMCWDQLDNDCSGAQDDNAIDCMTFYLDEDEDYFGTDDSVCVCSEMGEGDYTAWDNGDCDDGNQEVNPEMWEICDNELDDDCSGAQDDGEEASGCQYFLLDLDGDGWGPNDEMGCFCSPQAPYTGTDVGDCNDDDADINPDMPEVCFDGVDNDCNGQTGDFPPGCIE